MAEKKESLTALKMQLGKLQKKEQTPDVVYHKTGNTIEVTTGEVADSVRRLAMVSLRRFPNPLKQPCFRVVSLLPERLSKIGRAHV